MMAAVHVCEFPCTGSLILLGLSLYPLYGYRVNELVLYEIQTLKVYGCFNKTSFHSKINANTCILVKITPHEILTNSEIEGGERNVTVTRKMIMGNSPVVEQYTHSNRT